MEDGSVSNDDGEIMTRLANALQQELQREGKPARVIERLVSQPGLLHQLIELASADLVTIPDLAPAQLMAHLQEQLDFKYVEYPFSLWNFECDRHEQIIDGRGRTFEAVTWSPHLSAAESLSSEQVRRHFADHGYAGHVGAFLAWHLSLGNRQGSFACIPDEDACFMDPRQRLWVPYSYAAPQNTSLRLSPVTELWDSPFTFVAFRPFTGST